MKNRVLLLTGLAAAWLTVSCQTMNLEMPNWFQDEEKTVTDQQPFTQQVQVPANSRLLEIIHFNGNVEIEGWDESYILLEGVKRATGTTVEEARGKLEFISIYPYEKAPDRLVLEYNGPQSILPFGRSETGIDVKLSIPKNLPVEINCRRGDVKINGLQSNIQIDHRDGDVNVQNVQGQAVIVSQGRNVILKDISQRVNVKTDDANLSVENAKDNVTAHHTNGEARLTNIGGIILFYGNKSRIHTSQIRGRIQIENTGGDVECDTFYSGIQVNLKTGSLHLHPKAVVSQNYNCTVDTGDIIARMPANASMLADLKAEQGSIQSDFTLPITADRGISTARGAVNGGQVPVTLSVKKGNLSLTRDSQ